MTTTNPNIIKYEKNPKPYSGLSPDKLDVCTDGCQHGQHESREEISRHFHQTYRQAHHRGEF